MPAAAIQVAVSQPVVEPQPSYIPKPSSPFKIAPETEEDKDGGNPNYVIEDDDLPQIEIVDDNNIGFKSDIHSNSVKEQNSPSFNINDLDEKVKRAIKMKPRSLSFVFKGAQDKGKFEDSSQSDRGSHIKRSPSLEFVPNRQSTEENKGPDLE